MDLSAPLPPQPLHHKNYIENKAEIDRLITEPNAYPEKVADRDYLKDEYIKELYSKSVETYDLIWGGEWAYEARKETIALLEARPGERILEVGVGTGTNLAYYPDGCEITGIDYCQAMLKKAKRVCRPGGRLVIFDAIKSDIDEVAVIQHLFRPVARVLGPIYLEFCPPRLLPWNSFLDLFALLEKSGFAVEKAKATDPCRTINIIQRTNNKSRYLCPDKTGWLRWLFRAPGSAAFLINLDPSPLPEEDPDKAVKVAGVIGVVYPQCLLYRRVVALPQLF